MDYNLDFEYSALFFILPFFFIMIFKKRIPNLQNLLYSLMVIIITLSIIFDIASYTMLGKYTAFPLWSLYLVNTLFLTTQTVAPYLLFLYILSVTGKFKAYKRPALALGALPVLIVSALLVSNAFTHAIFFIDGYGFYYHGEKHAFLYYNVMFYIGFSLFYLITRQKYTDKNTSLVLLLFLTLLSGALVFQYINGEIIIANAACVLGLIMVYIFLQAPSHYIDKSTGLFNHNTLSPIIHSYFEKRKNFSFIVITIEEYKNITKLFGNKNSVRLMSKIGEHLAQTYGTNNVLRISSDQVGLFYFRPVKSQAALEELLAAFPNNWSVNESDIKITFSAVCLNSADYMFADTFINNTDFAMTFCRQQNNSVCYLDKKANEQIQYRFKVETLLKRALDADKIDVYFQPVFNLEKNCFTSLEALARLHDDDLGFIPPSVFIPLAEQNGMISKLGEIILEKVCMLIKMNDLKSCKIDTVDINLSVAQCIQSNLASQIINIIDKYHVPCDLLCFEVTETAATTSFSILKQNMEDISKRGIKFALDDYGMGYSSLNYLMKLPFSCLKTDRELLWSAMDNNRSRVLFECILYMAEKLDMTVISEGAETAEHLEFLRSMNVSLIQGFYYAKPMRADEMLEFIKRNNLKE